MSASLQRYDSPAAISCQPYADAAPQLISLSATPPSTAPMSTQPSQQTNASYAPYATYNFPTPASSVGGYAVHAIRAAETDYDGDIQMKDDGNGLAAMLVGSPAGVPAEQQGVGSAVGQQDHRQTNHDRQPQAAAADTVVLSSNGTGIQPKSAGRGNSGESEGRIRKMSSQEVNAAIKRRHPEVGPAYCLFRTCKASLFL
jgi:hypothetical protein